MTPEERAELVADRLYANRLIAGGARGRDAARRHEAWHDVVRITEQAIREAIAEEREACARIGDEAEESYVIHDIIPRELGDRIREERGT